MALKNEIQAQLVEAMKAKDDVRVSALRMLKAGILKFEVSGKEKKDATDTDIAEIVKKEIKSRRDSIEQFRAGGRDEMADTEEKEVAILMEFMPPQMSEDEIMKLAKEAIAETGAKSRQDMGRIMAVLMPKVKGMADGGVVNKVVNSLLS